MAIKQVDIIKMNECLQGKVDSFYDVIPASTKFDLDELLEVLIKLFRKGLVNSRKDVYLHNTLVAIDSTIDELSEKCDGVDLALADEASKLKEEYLEYAEKKGKKNDEILEILSRLSEYVYFSDSNSKEEEDLEEEKEEVPEKTEEEQKEDIVNKITSSFTSLNIENDELRKENESLKRDKKRYQKSLDSKTRQLDDATKELIALRAFKKDSFKKTNNLEKRIHELNEQVQSQKGRIDQLDKDTRLFNNQQAEIIKLKDQLNAYRQKEKAIVFPKNSSQAEVLHENVKRSIINLLMNSPCSFADIEKMLQHNKLLLNRGELFLCLKEIQTEYQVATVIGSGGKIFYKIENPSLAAPLHIHIPNKYNSTLDLILTADWHQYVLNNSDFKKMESLYEYCTRYGIHLIFNLGDLVDYDYTEWIDNRAKFSYNVQKRIEELATYFPFDSSISQYILGGNHDEQLRRLRIDVLKLLSALRPDFYNLGYTHAFVDIENATFALHHPDKKIDALKEYRNYLQTYYASNNLDVSYDDIFMNLFGHFHCFKYFDQEGYISVPSLTRDTPGAVHMRLFIDRMGNIENVEIVPLNYNQKVGLLKGKTMVYKKTNTKKDNK